ncbi:MAG: hypothetical protein AAF389_01000 [Gemmatimonadota bacterium]
MRIRRVSPLLVATLAGACYTPPDGPPTVRAGGLEPTALVLQAVDAGTGSALSDAQMTVRYLVRAPIVFDVSAVDRVPSIEPYEIEHAVDEPNLVVEVRLEADSYHRLDTVLTIPKGSTQGPMTMRLSPRLDRVASRETPVDNTPDPDPVATGEDRSAMQAGDRAFNQQAWLEAAESYQRMPAPSDDMNEYGRAFRDAKVRQGVAHLNRSEYARALEVFEEVADLREPGAEGLLRLSQAQCAVGRNEEGLGTLAQLGRMRNRMQPLEQNYVSAMIAYRRGICSHNEFERAETQRDRVRAGARAIEELNAFSEGARQMSPVPPEVARAVEDAERLVEEIQRTIVGRG